MKPTQIGGPDKGASESNCVCPFNLLLECVFVVVRDPLVFIENQIFDGGCLVVNGFYIGIFGQDLLDLIIG